MLRWLFGCRSKRRKHSTDVDTVVGLLSQLSSVNTSADSTVTSSSDISVGMSHDVIAKLRDMLTAPRAHISWLSVDISALNSTLQVGLLSNLVTSNADLWFCICPGAVMCPDLLIAALYKMFACLLNFPTYFFLTCSLLLFHFFENSPLHFQAGCHKRRLSRA